MDDLIAGYRRDMERRGLAHATVDKRTRNLRLFESEVGLVATKEQVEVWLDGRGLVAKSRSVWLSHLACFYSWAVQDGRLKVDPTARIQRPKLRRKLPRPIPDKDLRKALANADPRMRCWLLLGALAGLRCQEIAGVAVEDVLEDAGQLRVVDAKGGTERMVPLHPEVLKALRELLPPRGPVFRGTRGRVTAGDVSHKTGDYLHGLGITSTPHALRHWYATEVYRSTLDLRLTQELMGHKSVTSTEIYARADMQKAGVAVRALRIGA
jgi:integrase/recombinase XerC